MAIKHADVHLLGRRQAKCPACGCQLFQEARCGPLLYRLVGDQVELDWAQSSAGYLCAGKDCGRPFTLADLKDQEKASGNGDAVVQP